MDRSEQIPPNTAPVNQSSCINRSASVLPNFSVQEPSDNGVYRGEPESPVEGHDLQQISIADESDQISFNAAYVNQPLDTIPRRESVKLENCNWTKYYQRIRNFGIGNRKLYV